VTPPRNHVRWAVALGLLGACSSTGPVDLEQLDDAQDRWSRRAFTDYTYEARILCYCPTEIVSRVRVEVRDDSIASVTDVATDQQVARTFWNAWNTVDDLFQRIRQAPRSSGVVRVDATYDAGLGFPRDVDFVPDEGIADGGWSQTIFELAPLTDP
jgi:hypothetical protein